MNSVADVLAQGAASGFWGLVLNSGPIAQIVLLILLLFSLLSWTIIFKKIRFYRQVEEQSLLFYEHFKRTSTLSDIYQSCHRYSMSPLAGIFKNGYEEVKSQIEVTEQARVGATEPQNIVTHFYRVERALQRAAMAEITTLETSLNWLATTGAVTPFIGLFGTVIGIINAFQGLGSGAATTIQAVAPGISEALVATATGLFAAIPAVIAYNHFINRLKIFGTEMDHFSAELLNLIERSFT